MPRTCRIAVGVRAGELVGIGEYPYFLQAHVAGGVSGTVLGLLEPSFLL